MASKPNAIRSIVHVAKSRCAFVNFTDRADAESAALAWGAGLEIDGVSVGIKWGRSRSKAGNNTAPAPESTAQATSVTA